MSRTSPALRRGVAPQFSIPAKPPIVSPHEEAPLDNSADPQPITTTAASTTTNIHPFVKPQDVVLEPVITEDVDRLWDWAREDSEGVSAFLGVTFANSRLLFTYVEKVSEQERKGHAAFYAIRENDALLGFVLLYPIVRQANENPVGTTHIYLEPKSRGRLPLILPALMSEADRLAPGVNLCVITQRMEWAAMLESAGFKSHFVLTRHATKESNHGS